jgi:hypothetical protein
MTETTETTSSVRQFMVLTPSLNFLESIKIKKTTWQSSRMPHITHVMRGFG